LGAASCVYTPDEKVFLEVEKKIPQTSISLNNYNNKDTIYLIEPASFQYNASAVNVSILGTEVLLGSTQLLKTNNANGYFLISDNNLRTGVFELKIQLTSRSGTGSLADRLGIETTQIWKKWIVIIDVDPPVAPTLTATKENGFLKISWTHYERKNFRNYQLIINQSISFTITDPNKNFYIDSTYIGPMIKSFMVSVNTNLYSTTSNVVTIDEPQSVQFSYNPSDTTAILKWRKIRFEGAFKEVVIMENNTIRKTIMNAADTIVTLKLNEVYFGSTASVSLKIYPKYPLPYSQPFSFSEYIRNPLDLPEITANKFYYNKILDALMGYSTNDGYLKTYNSFMKAIDSVRIFYNFRMPYPGNYIYYPVTGGISQYNIITKQVKTIQTKGHYNSYPTPYSFIGADNDLVIYSLRDYTNFWDVRSVTRLVNFSSGETTTLSDTWYDPKGDYDVVYSGSFGSRVLSDDGKYVIYNYQIFRVSGVDLINPSSLPSAQEFRPDNSEEIISTYPPVGIYKTSNASFLRNISPPETGCLLVNYDPATKNILYSKYSENKVYLVNIETSAVITVRASYVQALMNGILFDGNGHYLKVL
jgi:hypothetical protein